MNKNVLDIWFDLVLKAKCSTIMIFKAIFLCQECTCENRRTAFAVDIF